MDDLSAGSGPLGFKTLFTLILAACLGVLSRCALWSGVSVVLSLQGVLCVETQSQGIHEQTDSKLPEQLKSRWWFRVLLLMQSGLTLVHHLGHLHL